MLLDRESPVPLYHQISEELRRQILAGELAPGEALPTEEALLRLYEVSRATIRQAVRQLVSAGLVRPSRPHGTFVLDQRLVEPLPSLLSFSEEVRRAGLTPDTRVLAVEPAASTAEVAGHLRLPPGEPVLCVRRLRLADSQPVAVQTSWLPTSLGIRPGDDLSGSLYGLLAARGFKPERADQFLDAVAAMPTVAELLEVPRRAPLLAVTRTTYDGHEHPIEYVIGYYRADRYRYSVQLSGAPHPSWLPSGLVTVERRGAPASPPRGAGDLATTR